MGRDVIPVATRGGCNPLLPFLRTFKLKIIDICNLNDPVEYPTIRLPSK